MSSDADRYEAYYAEKLWALLPEIYRAEDSAAFDVKGPLRELVDRVGAQAAILRRSVDRLWEDQSIETCDEWVIPYVADLLATNLVAGLDGRGQRLDVANTIFYRRRKGTVVVLEQIASDITGWDARVVEFFRRMARSRHGLDPAIGWPEDSADPALARSIQEIEGLVGRATRTQIGGFADLRNAHGASLAHTAFDELFHTGDVRLGRGKTGWHNISHLGVFLWRLYSVPLDEVTPIQDAACPEQYTFDPTGRDIPLFADSDRTYGDQWISPAEHQVPGPISKGLLRTALEALYPASLRVYRVNGATPNLIPVTDVTADPLAYVTETYLDPERGRLYLEQSAPLQAGESLRVGYHYGFSSSIGAGGYDRRVRGQTPGTPTMMVTGGGALPLLGPTGDVLIMDSLTYVKVPDVTVSGKLIVRAENRRRPVVRLPQKTVWTFTGKAAELVIDGLLVSGGDVVLDGDFESVTLFTSTLDPGDPRRDPANPAQIYPAADGRPLDPTHLVIAGQVRNLTIDRSITGPIAVVKTGLLERLTIRDSIVQSVQPKQRAIYAPGAAVAIERASILGRVAVHHIDVSNSILHDVAAVEDNQRGCVRFSAWSTGSVLPKRYESLEIAASSPIFTSNRFGDPGYLQLVATTGPIAEGAEDGSEMGAFSREKNAIKERGLRIKYKEYMPFGLAPVIIYVT